MKRLILLPLLPFFLFGALQAQNLNFGIKAGFQTSTMTHVSDAKTAVLYHAGAFAEMPLIDRLKVQAEALVSAQGINDSESDEYKQRNLYLQVPVLAKFQVWNRLSVHAGLQLGFLMAAHLKIDDGDSKEKYENKEDYKKTEIGFFTGAEYLITPNIGVGLRMNWGLGKVFVDYDRSYQRVFQVSATYRLNESAF